MLTTWDPFRDVERLFEVDPRTRSIPAPFDAVRTADEVFAVHDECTHGAVPLSDADVDGHTIECWMHGSRFDLRTGAALNLPATEPVHTFPVRVIDGIVGIDMP